MRPAHTVDELLAMLADAGWRLKGTSSTKKGYTVTGEAPHGEKVKRSGETLEMALAALVGAAKRSARMFSASSDRTWDTNEVRLWLGNEEAWHSEATGYAEDGDEEGFTFFVGSEVIPHIQTVDPDEVDIQYLWESYVAEVADNA